MGRYWAIGPQITDEEQRDYIKQMQRWGATPAQVEKYKASVTPDHCEVLEENAEAVNWFLSVDDFFRVDIQTGFLMGLDITAVKADADMRGLEITPDNYNKLRIIGRVAASEHNKQRSS